MADEADLRVRLSAEGVAEVVQALRTIQEQSAATGKGASQSFTGLNTTLGGTRAALRGVQEQSRTTAQATRTEFAAVNGVLGGTTDLLAQFGLVLSVGAFVAFTRSAADSARELEDMAEGVGTSTERLSGLAVLAQRSGVDIDRFSQSLGLFDKHLTALREHEPAAEALFRKLGLSARDFDGKDSAESLELVADRMGRLEDSAGKTTLAIDLFGRSGRRIIPVLNDLARVGLEGTIEQGHALGLVLDEEVVASAGRASEDLKLMEDQARSLATELAAGLAPAATQAMTSMGHDVARSEAEWRIFGQTVGAILKAVLLILATGVDLIITLIGQISAVLALPVDVLLQLVTGRAKQIPHEVATLFASIKRQAVDFDRDMRERFADLFGPPPAPPAPLPPGGTVPLDPQAEFAKRLERVKAATAEELKLLEEKLRFEESREKARFDRGLIDIGAYYTRRRQLLEGALAQEVKLLRARESAELQNPDTSKGREAARQTEAEVRRKQLETHQQVVTLTNEEIVEQERLERTRVGFENRVREAQGQTHAAAVADIDIQANDYEKLLAQLGVGFKDLLRLSIAFRETLGGSAQFDAQARAFTQGIDQLRAREGAIQADENVGTISRLAGERQIRDLKQSEIPVLERIVTLELEAARLTGDPEKIARAQADAQTIRELGQVAEQSTVLAANLKEEVGSSLGPALQDFFAGGKDGAKSFGDAFQSMIFDVIQSLRRLLAEIISSRILELLGFTVGNGALAGAGAGASVDIGAEVPTAFAAEGGQIHGAGTTTSDSIPIRVSNEEFIVRAAVVRQPGVLRHLETLNAGTGMPGVTRHSLIEVHELRERRGFAGGGLVQGVGAALAGPAGERGSMDISLRLERGLVLEEIRSPEGQRTVVSVLGGNRKAAGRALGGRS